MAEDEAKVKYTIMNILASMELKQELDLEKVSECLKGSEYNPSSFEGVVYRPPGSYAVAILLKDGKVVCTNVRSLQEVEEVFDHVLKELKRCGIFVEKKICPSCGAVLDKGDLVCLECGYVFPEGG